MKSMRSKFQQVGIVACGLSLGLFGCPQTGTGDDGGADSGLQAAADPGGGSGGNAGGGGGDTGSGGGGDTGSGGGGDTGGGSDALDRSAIVRPNSPTLFVSNSTDVTSFAGANALDGNVAPTTFIDSFKHLLTSDDLFPLGVKALCVDRTGTLVVRTPTPALRFYHGAATVTDTPAPNREISGPASRLADIADDSPGMVYDRANDRLFVHTSDRVLVFEGAALAQSGEATPTRVFSNADFFNGTSIALGPNGDLYVADGFQSVLAISNAGLRTGEVTPDRVIFMFGFTTEAIFVDSLDRLYVSDFDEIAVLNNASTLDGELAFDAFPTMRLAGVRAIDEESSVQPEIEALAVDSRGIGYVADIANQAIHVIDNIGTRTGDVRADRAIHGPAVEFDRPFVIFLWE